MKKIKLVYIIVLLLSIAGCNKPILHECIYAFEDTKEATPENIDKVISVLNKRLNVYGLRNTIEAYEEDKIKIIIESYSDILKMKGLNRVVSNKGKLEFWETFDGQTVSRNLFLTRDGLERDSRIDSILDATTGIGYSGQPILFYIKPNDTLNVVKSLNSLKSKLTGEQRFVKFLYGKPGDDGSLPIYTIKSNRKDKAVMSGNVVTQANQNYNSYNGLPVISFSMNKTGALEWERLTGKAYKENSQIALVINDIVFSAPSVSAGPIKGGKCEISGNFTKAEALELAAIISGKGEIPQLNLYNYTNQPQ